MVAGQPLLLPWRFMCWQLLQSALTQGTYSHSDSQAMAKTGRTCRQRGDSNQCETYAHPLAAALIQLYQKKFMVALECNVPIPGSDIKFLLITRAHVYLINGSRL